MDESKMSPGELYLEKSRQSGLMNRRNKEEFEEVAEMLEHPYSLEQVRAQIKRADDEREEQRKKGS